ncbi:P27 family phage terminase small subunit [Paenibacillus sp. HN-1]|uniref:P27 family phage terminase small subunit n=1 Tax=Paenibacillus TaxID=44249 RepID=UPI001CA96C07|nr:MULTISPECIES: P27 family phage terminase small subunit [Paenibacillus]MBY9077267.1 P27 family phage terminase small subunit [Paenibacillus sp. CGMCC 1.18879]MBY9083314.1 P27 family phage terminase small subunit [Paenibacillus sinensis]
MGRNAKPIGLHIAEGNPNRLTREQLRQRQEGEVKLGKTELEKLKPPAFVKDDVVAFSHWKQCLKEYKEAAKQDVNLLTSSDVGLLAMYCRTYSEYEKLLKQYQRLERIAVEDHVFDEYFQEIVRNAEAREQDVNEYGFRAQKYLSQLASIEGVLKIETAINKKMDMLLKMQDRLFLNPLSKVKNVPKPKAKETAPGKFGRFGGGRGG